MVVHLVRDQPLFLITLLDHGSGVQDISLVLETKAAVLVPIFVTQAICVKPLEDSAVF